MDINERVRQILPLRKKLDYYGLTKDILIISDIYKNFDNYVKSGKEVKKTLYLRGLGKTISIKIKRTSCLLNLS